MNDYRVTAFRCVGLKELSERSSDFVIGGRRHCSFEGSNHRNIAELSKECVECRPIGATEE